METFTETPLRRQRKENEAEFLPLALGNTSA